MNSIVTMIEKSGNKDEAQRMGIDDEKLEDNDSELEIQTWRISNPSTPTASHRQTPVQQK